MRAPATGQGGGRARLREGDGDEAQRHVAKHDGEQEGSGQQGDLPELRARVQRLVPHEVQRIRGLIRPPKLVCTSV
jgi:hypothetical protein